MTHFSKRQRGQLNALDVLVLLMLGSSVETAMVQASTSFYVGVVSCATLLIANFVITQAVKRSPKIAKVCADVPMVLVNQGQFVEENLKRANLTHDDVLEGLRERGQEKIDNLKYAMLETDGEISFILNK